MSNRKKEVVSDINKSKTSNETYEKWETIKRSTPPIIVVGGVTYYREDQIKATEEKQKINIGGYNKKLSSVNSFLREDF